MVRRGHAQPGADDHRGQAVDSAVHRKRLQTHPELAHARQCRLVVDVVVGVGVGSKLAAALEPKLLWRATINLVFLSPLPLGVLIY